MYRKTADASGPFLAESGEGPAAGRRLQVADRESPTGGWRLTAECRLRLKADCARLFFVKHFSPFSSFHIPIVIMGNSSLSAGLVRIQIPQLRPAA